jgi:DNA-binding MarR family transcriptional regulator
LTEIIVILAGILLAVTVGVFIEYSKRLRKTQREYEKAREAVEEIVLSFNRQLKQEANKLEITTYKVEALTSKSERALSTTEEVNRTMTNIDAKVNMLLEDKKKTLARLEELDKKAHDIGASQEAVISRLSTAEEQMRRLSAVPEAKIEAVIPIRREKALAPLTETELAALEMLATEGPKTAPEIKERIKLSREHTARLMKKLYEGGYLERETNKIPFRYHIKEEMGKLLKKVDSEAL